jgi:hypothetical protein
MARPTLFSTLHPHHTPMPRSVGGGVAWCGEGVAETAPSPRVPACGCVAREGTMGALACVLKSDNAEDIGVAVGLRVRPGARSTLSMPIAISISDSACSVGGAGDRRICVYALTCWCGHAYTPPRPRSPHATNHACMKSTKPRPTSRVHGPGGSAGQCICSPGYGGRVGSCGTGSIGLRR